MCSTQPNTITVTLPDYLIEHLEEVARQISQSLDDTLAVLAQQSYTLTVDKEHWDEDILFWVHSMRELKEARSSLESPKPT